MPVSAWRRWLRIGRDRSAAVVAADLSRKVGRVLVTGSAGQVGQLLLPLWRADPALSMLELRLADRRGRGAERADLVRMRDCRRVVQGIDAIVHLAGYAKEADLAALWPSNVLALSNLLDAAVEAGVSRFVFASSMHVMGMYRREDPIDESMPPRPDSLYATTKLHGEALCRMHAERHGLAVTCLRLGAVGARVEDVEPGSWIAPEDVLAMVRIGLAADRPGFEIFHAVADAPGSPLPASRAEAFGYRCSRTGEPYADSLARAARWWPADDLARLRRGASFASASRC